MVLWSWAREIQQFGKAQKTPHPTSMSREKESIHDILGTCQSDFLYQQFWSSLV
jgi:hypothetical protein